MDSEFCEIDFTTATLWENFTSKIEEIFYSWKLYQSQETYSCENCECFSCEHGIWYVKNEKIDFRGKEFNIFYYCRQINQPKSEIKEGDRKNDPENSTAEENQLGVDISGNYFPLDVNCLSKNATKYGETEKLIKLIRLYDLQNFVLFVPTDESASIVSSESNVKFLMSSFCMSAFNTRCFIPVFVQVFQLWQNCFVGVRVDEDGFRTDYQMVHLGKIPQKMHYLSGLVDMFKSKLLLTSYSNYIWASVKLSYCISHFVSFAYPALEKSHCSEESSDITDSPSFSLPFGATCEPINDIRLHVAWPKVHENMVMDNENHSDFDPLRAPNWSLQVSPKNTRHLLSHHFIQFLQTCKSTTNISELIGDLLKRKNFNVTSDLNVSTNLSISKIIAGGNNIGVNNANTNENKRTKRYLPEDTMVSMLYYLFPDADQNNTYPFVSATEAEDSNEDASLKGMKTCAVGELPWRLSSIMCIIVSNYGEHAAAQFWYEFIEELRFRWEKCLRLLGVQKGVPNHKTSLINQKLQMLNCCIQKRMRRERLDILSDDSDEQTPSSGVHGRSKNDSEDEEFFDCQTESREYKDAFDFNIARVSLWNQPEGRLRKFNNSRLIETGDHMYIPITQEMTPKTEDQLEDDAVVLMKLGSDSEGSKLRARMMCASLYSDMESFKAANPGAVLADFIRWYSPRDWIESDELDKYGQKKGKLSNRMMLPGNMWKEVWETSIPVPAYRQKCLFDDRKESEKVLHFFESHKSLADVFTLLLPTLLHATLYTIIHDENVSAVRRYSSSLNDKINTLAQKAVSATRNMNIDFALYLALAEEIKEIEDTIMQYKSLELKLFPVNLSTEDDDRKTLLELVLGKRQIILPDGPNCRLGRRVIFVFAKEQEEMLRGNMERNRKEDGSSLTHNATNEFLHNAANSVKDAVSSHHTSENAYDRITASPYQKEFVLHVNSPYPSISSRANPHILSAHVCNEEIILATSFTRDSIFV